MNHSCLKSFDSNRYVISSIKRKNVSLVFNIFSDPHKMDIICLPSSHIFVIKDLLSSKDYMSIRKPNSSLQSIIPGCENMSFSVFMERLLSLIETSCLFEIKKYNESNISLLLNCPEKRSDVTYEFERVYSGNDFIKTPNVIFFPGIYQSHKDLSDEIDQLRSINQSMVDELKILKASYSERAYSSLQQSNESKNLTEEPKLEKQDSFQVQQSQQVVEIRDNHYIPSELEKVLKDNSLKLVNIDEKNPNSKVVIPTKLESLLAEKEITIKDYARYEDPNNSLSIQVTEFEKLTKNMSNPVSTSHTHLEGSEMQNTDFIEDHHSMKKKYDKKAKTVKLTRGDQNVILKYRRNKGAPVRRYLENPGDFSFEKIKKAKELSTDMAIFDIISISDEEYACGGGKTTMKPVQTFDNCNIEIRSTKTHEIVHLLIGHQIPICNLLLLYSNTLVSGDQAGNMVVWELTNYTYIGVLKGHTDKIYEIIQLRGDMILTSSADKKIIVWDAINYKQITVSQPFEKPIVSAFMLSETEFLSCSSNIIKKMSYDKEFQEIESLIVDMKMNTLARVSKKLFAVGFRNGMIRTYKIKGFELVNTLKGHTDNITKIIKLSSDLIATSSYDERLKIWNFKENIMVKSLSGQGGKMISCFRVSNNEIITTTGNEAVILWESQA